MMMSHEICNICDELGKEDGNYYSYIKDIGLPDSCPLPPVRYISFTRSHSNKN